MGEVAVSSEEEGLEKQDGSATAVQWERFLPRMALRVLLVEADDSTRQIIAALLRKCSYKVSAVPDGLRAWQILKGKDHNIDLVLTEVELPCISGFALLTLVTEHDVCKSIPVIMMSSHDSISMVLKCMLKGAADLLIKPVRKNELRNLWQHVWRRQNIQDLSHPKCKNASDLEKQEGSAKLPQESVIQESETEDNPSKFGSDVVEPLNEPYNSIVLRLGEDQDCAKATTHYESVGSESAGNGNITSEGSGNRREADEPLSAAIDFIGTFDNHPMCSHVHSGSIYGPQLELSLRRFCPSSFKDDKTNTLSHSNASAISWYNSNKTLRSFFPTLPGTCTELEEGVDKIRNLLSENTIGNSENCAPLGNNEENTTSLIEAPSGKAGLRYSNDFGSTWSPKPACDETWNNCDDQIVSEEKSLGEVRHEEVSSATGQSCSSSLCNGVANDGLGGAGMGALRSSEREAALTKFRLKRKDRCYEKKVRYQSRKRLAEQRPRVKGQFVRQVQTSIAGADG